MIAETEPFCDENGEEEEEEGLVEICVPHRDSTHNRKGEVDVRGKDVTTRGLCVGPMTGDQEGFEGECVVLVNGKVGVAMGRGGNVVSAIGGVCF